MYDLYVADRCFEKMAKETEVKNQNCDYESNASRVD
jgi:hypothetical protein